MKRPIDDYDPGYYSVEPLKKQLAPLNLPLPHKSTARVITQLVACRTAQEFEAYYEDANNSYRIRDERGTWIRLSEQSLRLHAAGNGISSERAKTEDLSPCDRWLIDIQKNKSIGYVGPLAGFREGLYQMGGRNVLVNSSPSHISPTEGKWETIRQIIEGGLFTLLFFIVVVVLHPHPINAAPPFPFLITKC